MGTRGAWGIDLAKALGNPNPSASTVNWIAAWTKGENTKAKFNPLATTLKYGDSDAFNDNGGNPVRNYQTREQGIQATVETLRSNYPGYEDIREGIRNDDPERASNGLIRAPWGTNGALVKSVWSLYDVRDEPLLSEQGQAVSSGGLNKLPGHGDSGSDHYTPGQSSGGSNEQYNPRRNSSKADDTVIRQGTTSEGIDYPQRALYIGAGVLLVGITLFLVVRNYVPTTQIVKTIEAAT